MNEVTSQYDDSDAENIPGEEIITVIEYDQANNKTIFRRKSQAAPLKRLNSGKKSFKEPEKRRVATKIEKPQARFVVFSSSLTTRNMKRLEERKFVNFHILLRNVWRIQNCLVEDYDEVNLPDTIALLNEIICDVLPDVSKLMLLKYPKSVEKLMRMRKYVGNIEEWNLDEEEEAKFNEGAETIRNMATSIGDYIMVSSEISRASILLICLILIIQKMFNLSAENFWKGFLKYAAEVEDDSFEGKED